MEANNKKTDAIVFIPGSFQPWEEPIVKGLGERMVIALERNSPTQHRFFCDIENPLPDPFSQTQVAKISVAHDKDEETKHLVDLYSLSLVEALSEPFKKASTLKKGGHLAFHIITLLPKIVVSFFRKDLSFRGRLQVIFCGAVMVLMMLSFLFILATLIAGFASLAQTDSEAQWLGNIVNWALPFSAAVLAVLHMIPRKLRSSLESCTVFVLSFIGYLSAGIGRDPAIGKLASFLECLEENNQYRKIHILSFGMGCVVALDALFPRQQPILRFKVVDTLVTVACPADIILHYYPDYLTERRRHEGIPKHWMNVFVPADLMASNFIEADSFHETPDERRTRKIAGIIPRTTGQLWSGIRLCYSREKGIVELIHPDANFRRMLTSPKGKVSRIFAAIRAHQSYWDKTNINSDSVLDTIAQKLFPSGGRDAMTHAAANE